MRPKGYLKDNPKTADLVPQFALSDMSSWHCHVVDGIILVFLTHCQSFSKPPGLNVERNCLFEACCTGSPILSCQTCKLTQSLHVGARKLALCVRLLSICDCDPNRGLCRSAETCLDHGVHDGKHGCTWLDLSSYCSIDLVAAV